MYDIGKDYAVSAYIFTIWAAKIILFFTNKA